MRHGIKTCAQPTDKNSIYMRNMYHEFFWGPFANEQDCAAAIATLDKADSYWDYDPFCMIYGADPLPKDFVFGFPSVPEDVRKRVMALARPNASTPHEIVRDAIAAIRQEKARDGELPK